MRKIFWNRSQLCLRPTTLAFAKCDRMLYISESFIKIFRNLCFDTETHSRILPPLYCTMVSMFPIFCISSGRDLYNWTTNNLIGKILLRLIHSLYGRLTPSSCGREDTYYVGVNSSCGRACVSHDAVTSNCDRTGSDLVGVTSRCDPTGSD